eukprot:5309036-Prymnesium_polylepis.1
MSGGRGTAGTSSMLASSSEGGSSTHLPWTMGAGATAFFDAAGAAGSSLAACTVATHERAAAMAVDGSTSTICSMTPSVKAMPTRSWKDSVGSSNVHASHSSSFVVVACPAATLAWPVPASDGG